MVHFPCFAGYVQTWCAPPRSVFFFFFFENFVSYNLSIVCYASICAHRGVHRDGRANAAWATPKGLRSIARPLCTTLMDTLGQPPRCEVEELWAILTLEPEYTDSKGCPRYYHPSGRQYRKEGIIGNNCPCTDYSITRCHKPVSTAVTSKCYQGCLNPI